MSPSRRHFLASSSLAALAAAFESSLRAQDTPGQQPVPGSQAPPVPHQPTPGAPPAFRTPPAVGPMVTADDFPHAEKLVQFEITDAERDQAAANSRIQMPPPHELRT